MPATVKRRTTRLCPADGPGSTIFIIVYKTFEKNFQNYTIETFLDGIQVRACRRHVVKSGISPSGYANSQRI